MSDCDTPSSPASRFLFNGCKHFKTKRNIFGVPEWNDRSAKETLKPGHFNVNGPLDLKNHPFSFYMKLFCRAGDNDQQNSKE